MKNIPQMYYRIHLMFDPEPDRLGNTRCIIYYRSRISVALALRSEC